MIGLTTQGGAVDDWLQFTERAKRVLTTPLGTRQKRPEFGCKLPTLLAKNLGDGTLILAQSYVAEAFYNKANGVSDFEPATVVASRRTEGAGLVLQISGTWRNRKMVFEVDL